MAFSNCSYVDKIAKNADYKNKGVTEKHLTVDAILNPLHMSMES